MEAIRQLFDVAAIYGSLNAMEKLNSRPGFTDSLDGIRPGRRDEFNSELQIIRETTRIMEEQGVDEYAVARVLASLAVAGVAYDSPDYYTEYEKLWTALQPISPEDRGKLHRQQMRTKVDTSWWGGILDGIEEINALDPITHVATPGLAIGQEYFRLWMSGVNQLFGSASSTPDIGELPAMTLTQRLGNMDVVQINVDIYVILGGAYIIRDSDNWIKTVYDGVQMRRNGNTINRVNDTPLMGRYYIMITLLDIPIPGGDVVICPSRYRNGNYDNSVGFAMWRADLGLPEIPLVNSVAQAYRAIGDDMIDDPRERYILPPIPMNPADAIPGAPAVDWGEHLRNLRETAADPTKSLANQDTGADTGTGTDTGTQTGTCTQTAACECAKCKEKAGELPVTISGVNWGKLSASWGRLASVFPFCLPFDLIGIFTAFTAPPRELEPVTVNILPFLPGDAGMITLDFNIPGFDMLLKLFRTGVLILFSIGLIMATRGLITW
jgi:hypothetical protein